ncbi:hypothetical protein BKI52_31970 [marine bacterium AO1-C]|nr:hypothetical protein BKI52_31970 [marine bacterium AO1-C]
MLSEDFVQIKRLLESGLSENVSLAWQLCLGKDMQYWQIFSLIGYWVPMQRINRYASIEDAEDLLWSTNISGVEIEFIEFEYHNFHYDYYLRIDRKEVNLKQYYHRNMMRDKQSITQIRGSFVKGAYQQQAEIEVLCMCNEKLS